MPLAQCPDCRGNVSTAARTCPHCGRPGPFADAADSGAAPGVWPMSAGYPPPAAPGYPQAAAGVGTAHGSPYAGQQAGPAPVMECPECRLRTTNRTYCTRCNERLVPAAHLPPHRFPSTPVDYAGFGARFSAGLIDVVVLLPLLALTTWIETRSPASAALGAVLSIFLFGGYQVGLVALRGQTVGKRVMDIQVRRADGSAVGFGEAFMRYLPFLVQLVVGSLGQIVAASALTQADFDLAGGLMGRSGMLSGAGPGWAVAVNTLMTFFVLADVIVFFANRRHRALHDVIAGTVVVHV